MGELWIALGEGALLAAVGLPLLAWSARGAEGTRASDRQAKAFLTLLLGASLLFVPALAAAIPHPALSLPMVAGWHGWGAAAPAPVGAGGFSFQAGLRVLGMIWLGLVVLSCVLGLWRALRLKALRSAATLAPTGLVMEAVELSRAAGMLPPWVLVSDEARVPFIAGVLRPYVIIPRTLLDSLQPRELSMVIAHELCHLDRGDPWKACAVGLLRGLLWPHPTARALVVIWAQAREEAVDALVAEPDPGAYAHLLLDVAAHTSFGPREAFLVSIRSSSLERRITMLTRPSRTQSRSMFLTLALAVALGGLGLVLPAAQADAPVQGHVISLHVGGSADVSQAKLSRVAVGDPSVADIRVTGGDHLRVIAVDTGKTTLLVWSEGNGEPTSYVIDVKR